MTPELKTDVSGVGELLKGNHFTVPDHQRAFAWTDDEVDELWNDIINAMTEVPNGYFLGQVVLGAAEADESRREVIDGQQRLATVSLVYAAIAATFRERVGQDQEHQRRAEQIDSDYLATTDIWSLERTPHLELSLTDRAFFESILASATTGSSVEPASRASHRLLADAYSRIREHVRNYAPVSDPEWFNKVRKLSGYLTNKVRVISVYAGSEENAYLIFETLNDRGVQLTPADLLKNLLFSRAQQRLEEVKSSWANMSSTLDALSEQTPPATKYIRYFYISKVAHVRDKGLYKAIKETENQPQTVLDFVRNLESEAETYVALSNAEASTWSNHEEREAIRTITVFKARTVRPLLLAIAQKPATKTRTQLLNQAMCSTVRLAISGGLGKGTTEERFGSAARAVRDGGIRSKSQLRTALLGAAVTDADFEAAFMRFTVKNAPQARYLLRELEKKQRSQAGLSDELDPSLDASKLNLEHVLPKNPDLSIWSNFNREEVAEYAHRIGNHVLLNANLNRRLQNDAFSKKKEKLKESKLLLTAEVGEQKDWTIQGIERRQEQLAKLAVTIW